MNRPREIRSFRTVAPAAGEGGGVTGVAAPFDTPTMIGSKPWGFREKIARGAFAKSINDGDVVLLDNHDPAKPLARMSAGTLTLSEAKRGLEFDGDTADTSYARDALANIHAGNYGGCSFGFEVITDEWTTGEDGTEERTLKEVKLYEISVVTFPAYTEGTEVCARDAVAAARESRKLREGGGELAPAGEAEPAPESREETTTADEAEERTPGASTCARRELETALMRARLSAVREPRV